MLLDIRYKRCYVKRDKIVIGKHPTCKSVGRFLILCAKGGRHMEDKRNVLIGYEIKDKGDTIVVENLYPKKKKNEK